MILYFVRMSCIATGEDFGKIGYTERTLRQRFRSEIESGFTPSGHIDEVMSYLSLDVVSTGDFPYVVRRVHTVEFTYVGAAKAAEQLALQNLASKKHVPVRHFSGESECFSYDQHEVAIIRKFMDDAAAHAAATEPDPVAYASASMNIAEKDPLRKHVMVLEALKRAQGG